MNEAGLEGQLKVLHQLRRDRRVRVALLDGWSNAGT
jgi:hypothetical protein